jgi:glycosyltransferase involved in cell wall biosynthesis
MFSSPWEEPFGLVLIEAGASGTPVVALRRGAAPEIVHEGVSGFLGADLSELAQVLPAAIVLDPAMCRATIVSRFDRPVIVRQLVSVFAGMLTPTDEEKVIAA